MSNIDIKLCSFTPKTLKLENIKTWSDIENNQIIKNIKLDYYFPDVKKYENINIVMNYFINDYNNIHKNLVINIIANNSIYPYEIILLKGIINFYNGILYGYYGININYMKKEKGLKGMTLLSNTELINKNINDTFFGFKYLHFVNNSKSIEIYLSTLAMLTLTYYVGGLKKQVYNYTVNSLLFKDFTQFQEILLNTIDRKQEFINNLLRNKYSNFKLSSFEKLENNYYIYYNGDLKEIKRYYINGNTAIIIYKNIINIFNTLLKY